MRAIAFVLMLVCQCGIPYVLNGKLHLTIKTKNENWRDVKKILSKMTPHLEIGNIEVPSLNDDEDDLEKVTFQDVLVVNWLSDVILNHVTSFDIFDRVEIMKNANDRDFKGYNGKDGFNLDERVVIVNFTIPQLLFTGRFLFYEDGKQGTVHCAMNNMAVGMFVHFSRTNNVVYVNNFQMTPPEKSFVLIDKDDRKQKQSEVALNVGYVNDSLESEWKLAIWLTTYQIIEDYVGEFILIDGNFFN